MNRSRSAGNIRSKVPVSEDALIPGRSPAIDFVSNQKWIVTKITDDPFIPLTQARMTVVDLSEVAGESKVWIG